MEQAVNQQVGEQVQQNEISKRVVLTSGMCACVGYLYLLLVCIAQRQNITDVSATISISVLAIVGAAGAIAVGSLLQGAIRSYLCASISLVLLILTTVASRQLGLGAGLQVLYGGRGGGFLATALVFLMITLGLFYARRQTSDSLALQIALGAGAGIVALMYLVQLLVVVGGAGPRNALTSAFSSGEPALIVYTSLYLLALVGIISLCIAAAIQKRPAENIFKAATLLLFGVLGLIILYSLVNFLLGLASSYGGPGQKIMSFVTTLIAGVLPLFGIVLLSIRSIAAGSSALADLMPVNTGQATTPKPEQETARRPQPRRQPDKDRAAMPSPEKSTEDQLKQLKEWYDNDLIEEEEYKSKRRELLDSM